MFKNKESRYTALGINIYGGGFTLGMSKFFNILAQLEEIKLGAKTFHLNFGQSNIFHTLDKSLWNLNKYKGVDVVYANPPCVPWSAASMNPKRRSGNLLEHRLLDPLLDLTQSTIEAALTLNPKIFIMESVDNAYNHASVYYEPITDKFLKAGYSVTYFLTDAIIHGAPCTRRRFHFIAHKICVELPTDLSRKFKPVTVRDVIYDLQDVQLCKDKTSDRQHCHAAVGRFKDDYVHLLQITPPWSTMRPHALKDPTYKGIIPTGIFRRLHWDYPAATIIRFHMIGHPEGKRFITWREGLRLMTYPDWFRTCSEVDAADAVLPIIGKMFSNVFYKSLDKNKKIRKPEFKLIDLRPLGKPFHGKVDNG